MEPTKQVKSFNELTPLEQKAWTFAHAMFNAYREEEEREELPMQFSLSSGGDFTEDLTAMVLAMFTIFKQVCREDAKDMDAIGFSHMINRLMIQFSFDDTGEGVLP